MGKTKLLDKPFVHKVLGTDPTKPDEMQPKEVLSYSFAGFGQNLICALVTSFFLFFLTDAVRLNAAWLAWMFLGARLFDAFNDPVMGTIVDRTRTKDGKMRPYLKATPIPIAIMTILLFIPYRDIIPNEGGAFALATIVYLIWGICYTIVDVPYWGLASSMTKDTDKRNTMLTVARLFCTIGAGIITVLLPIVQGMIESGAIDSIIMNQEGVAAAIQGTSLADGIGKNALMSFATALEENLVVADQANIYQVIMLHGQETLIVPTLIFDNLSNEFSHGYKIMYLVSAVIIALSSIPSFYIGYKNTKERFYDENSGKSSLGHNVKLLGKNRPILMLILVGVLGCLRLIYMTSGIYYAKYNCDNVGLFSIMTLLVVPGGLIATVLTPVLSRKFGKRNVFLYSHLVGGIAMLIVYFIGIPSAGSSTLSKILFFVVLVLLGVPSGFSNILQYSMIADSIDYLEDKTGERAEGICFSMQTFISKIGMAFTAFTTLIVLGDAYTNSNMVNIPDGLKDNIWMMSTLFAAISTIACCIPLFFYTFTEKKQAEAVSRIENRKQLKREAVALLDTATNFINVNGLDKDELIADINATYDELDKVFKEEDIDSIMTSLKNKDVDFFASLPVCCESEPECKDDEALDNEVVEETVDTAEVAETAEATNTADVEKAEVIDDDNSLDVDTDKTADATDISNDSDKTEDKEN